MDKEDILENCPHCGTKLSPWQKVLLNIDRAIMCKNCWYRIILPTDENESTNKKAVDSKDKKERGSNGNL